VSFSGCKDMHLHLIDALYILQMCNWTIDKRFPKINNAMSMVLVIFNEKNVNLLKMLSRYLNIDHLKLSSEFS